MICSFMSFHWSLVFKIGVGQSINGPHSEKATHAKQSGRVLFNTSFLR
jgi:hypothetical protein